MQNATDRSATGTPHAQDPGTGPGAEANTAATLAGLAAFSAATATYLDAEAALREAQARVHVALAESYQADPHLSAGARLPLVDAALHCALTAEDEAASFRRRARKIRREAMLELAPTAAAAEASEACAVVVVTIKRDQIRQVATLHMGGAHSVGRTWEPTSGGGWRSRDPEWIEGEERIGLELAEFMDAMPFPGRVAKMLPRRPGPGAAEAMRQAALEVGRG